MHSNSFLGSTWAEKSGGQRVKKNGLFAGFISPHLLSALLHPEMIEKILGLPYSTEQEVVLRILLPAMWS